MERIQREAAAIVGGVLAGRSLDAQLKAPRPRGDESTAERALRQDLAYGTLRLLGELDAILDALLDKPLKDERLRNLLRVALYQLARTRAAPHAVVDHAVRACAGLGETAARGLVNAVLRNYLRRREALHEAARSADPGRYSHPQWWIDRLRAAWPDHSSGLLDLANTHPPLTLRVNRRMTDAASYVARLAAADMAARPLGGEAVVLERPVPVAQIPGFADGEVSVQDAAAQYAAVALGAGTGARVLDACAAPGGKSAHILERADVTLVGLDRDPARVARISENLERLKLHARVICGDAAQPAGWWDGVPFTHVLADVPCSASGVARRHPDIKWLRRPQDIDAYARTQRAIIDALWQVLAGGGKFLYATCSLFREENQTQIERFLERHRDARQLPLPGAYTNAQELAGQILPDEHHDGFFYALIEKR